MQFQWQSMLVLLLAIPVLVALYIAAQRRRQKYALRYASLSLVKDALGKGPGKRRHIPPILFLIGLTAMIIALARPIAVVSLPVQEGTVILTLDVSGSMAAEDMKPNRMEAAKAAARTFVERQPKSIRIGVVSFSDNAFIVQAPTTDQDAVLAAINRLTPQRGTAIGRGILSSLDAIFEGSDAELPSASFNIRPSPYGPTPAPMPTPVPVPKGSYSSATVILLSDGESNVGPNPLDVIEQAANRGIRVHTVGVGTPEGIILRVQGRAIRVRLDEATLKKVAEATDGNYYNASNENDLRAIYENLGTRVVLRTERTEITAGLTGIAVLFSLLAGILSLLWFNRLP